MTTLMVSVICFYHSLLRVVGKIVGLLFAGLLVGFMQGVQDVRDMYKHLAYRIVATRKKEEKERRKNDDDNSDSKR